MISSTLFCDESETILDSACVGSHHALVTMRESRTDEVDIAKWTSFCFIAFSVNNYRLFFIWVRTLTKKVGVTYLVVLVSIQR